MELDFNPPLHVLSLDQLLMAMLCPEETITQLPLTSPMLDLAQGFEKSCELCKLFLPSLLLC